MRNSALHDALRAFATEAAALLRADQEAGAELGFDLEEGGVQGGPALYQYRPLTEEFIDERWQRLHDLDSCAAAAEALGEGAASYLRIQGMRGAEAEPALRAMLERLFEGASSFEFPEERFERVYSEVERVLYEVSQRATVLVPIFGLELMTERVELGGGVVLARGERTDAPDEAVWATLSGSPPEAQDVPNTLCLLERDVNPEDPLPLGEASLAFRQLLSGLRLFKSGGVALGTVAWHRAGDGRWSPFGLEGSGVARGEPWILVEGEEAELRQFLDTIDGSKPSGTVAWALSRFDLGCGQARDAEALSDYLLALRALLDAGGDSGHSSLALRLAALCAEGDERQTVQRRTELAIALERFVIQGGPDDDYLHAIGSESPRMLVGEVERHLRALLRDVRCGYLEPNLAGMADGILLQRAEFVGEVQASRGPRFERDTEVATAEEEAVAEGVTSSIDWDDDPGSWSAPV